MKGLQTAMPASTSARMYARTGERYAMPTSPQDWTLGASWPRRPAASHRSLSAAGDSSSHDATTDVDLLRRIADDDDQALRLFYRRYAGLVYSLAFRMSYDATRAEEILQETMVRVWRAAATFDPSRGRPETWVTTIARNLLVTAMRKQRPISLDEHEELANVLEDDHDGPEQIAWMNARRQLVREAVTKLPDNQRRVLLLAYFDGLSHSEIAERTGEPLGTVKSRLRLGLRRLESSLRSALADSVDDYPPESQFASV